MNHHVCVPCQRTAAIDALSEEGFVYDGQSYYESPNREVIVAIEDGVACWCDNEGTPYATTPVKLVPELARRITTEDALSWLKEWGAASGLQVTPH